MDIKDCLKQRFLIEIKPSADLVEKEFTEAAYDLNRSKKVFKEEDWKWAIIQAYYSMFHSARAVLFNLGFREKRHFAIVVVLEDLNKKGKLEFKYVNDFEAVLSSRENADYHYVYSKEEAKHSLEIAKDFLARMKKLLDKL
ncbi:MAG: HEPN domain-containing protein [Candidatus Pacearchaeota archaeon]|nr:MAG: HEPN domain-containing protein [Candidatus Pacearchaeota archaeon]